MFSLLAVTLVHIAITAAMPAGDTLRGKAMTRFVVIGAALPAHEGPFRPIVPGEKREARWVRQVSAVDVEDVSL